jgi:hypothetical protein
MVADQRKAHHQKEKRCSPLNVTISFSVESNLKSCMHTPTSSVMLYYTTQHNMCHVFWYLVLWNYVVLQEEQHQPAAYHLGHIHHTMPSHNI